MTDSNGTERFRRILHEDLKIRDYIRKQLKRSLKVSTIVLNVLLIVLMFQSTQPKPGMVIGKGGS